MKRIEFNTDLGSLMTSSGKGYIGTRTSGPVTIDGITDTVLLEAAIDDIGKKYGADAYELVGWAGDTQVVVFYKK